MPFSFPATTSSSTFCSVHCVIPHHCFELNLEIPFRNCRADLKISEFMYSYGGGRRLACNQSVSSDTYIIDRSSTSTYKNFTETH